MKPYTAADVARTAGVSQSTVSYVLSGRRPISEDTRRRVQDVLERLTYEPNHGARALASQETRVIGLVVPFDAAAGKAGLLPFIDTIATTLRENDYDLLLITSREGTQGLSRIARRRLCDGIILMDVKAFDDDRIDIAADANPPVTNVALEPRLVSLRAMRMLFDLLKHRGVGEEHIELVPTHLTQRATVMDPLS